jgi:S-methylmethionine-dependent homocysteine/selenocysteine methylase
MAEWLRDAGVDIILIETMNTRREAVAAVHAARRAAQMPIYASLVPMDEHRLLDGTLIAEAVAAVADAGADLVLLNCAPVSVMREAMTAFVSAARNRGIPFGCYPNASERGPDGTWDLAASSDEAIVGMLEEWLNAGASLVGSCCGTTPATTARLRSLISQQTHDGTTSIR